MGLSGWHPIFAGGGCVSVINTRNSAAVNGWIAVRHPYSPQPDCLCIANCVHRTIHHDISLFLAHTHH